MNMKFLFRIKSNELSDSTCVPRFWMLRMFGIPQQCNNAEQRYHKNFFCHSVDILQCNFKLPKKDNWKGHPFYWDLLVALEKLQVENEPNSFESVMSTSLWYNRDLGSTFNVDLANKGINFIRDLFYRKKEIVTDKQDDRSIIDCQVISLYNKIQPRMKLTIESNVNKSVIVHPTKTISLKKQDKAVNQLSSHDLYKLFIADKIKLPMGLLNWCLEFELSNNQIRNALIFASLCSQSIFDRTFQYKIVTNILPTNEYLARYRVKESDVCHLCNLERDTIVHRLYECETIVLKIEDVFEYLHLKCSVSRRITLTDYLFGMMGSEHLGLNHILLELKKYVFYSSAECISSPSFFNIFLLKIRNLIIKEKIIAQRDSNFSAFCIKWKFFTNIYDFRGPDPLIV